MKISNSSVFMSSTHQESSYTYMESATMEAAKSEDAVSAILTLSSRDVKKTAKEAMAEYRKEQQEEAEMRKQRNEARSLQHMSEDAK